MNLRPALVLTAVTTAVAALLTVTHDLTYVDTSGVLTEKLENKCRELMGSGSYTLIADWLEAGYDIARPDDVEKLIVKDDGSVAFEIVTSGYNKNGLDMLIAMDGSGSVAGVAVVSLTETPGLGSNVNDSGFLSLFEGISGEAVIVKKTPSADNEVEAVTGATYSSKGVAAAVNIAVRTFAEMGAGK